MKYQIVYSSATSIATAIKFLEENVSISCKKGWIPQGGVSITLEGCGCFYTCQAMIKE